MFCPGCGLKEDRPLQFCRACGADLRAVRESLERADAPEPSVAAAREEIARAIAARIREGQWWQAGGLAAEAEKLFETPRERRERRQREDEERRLARTRAGTVTAAVGLGLMILFGLLFARDDRAVLLMGPSIVVLLVGLGVIVNGLLFTRPREPRPQKLTTAPPASLPDNSTSELDAPRGELGAAVAPFIPASITEHTTQHLGGEALKTPRG
jgi:hypothetical protein